MLLEGKTNAFLRLIGSPRFIYGTAWKKDQSRELVKDAIEAGFRAVDTACQPKHYNEALVGQGVRDALKANGLRREDVFLQTKFTQPLGQDPKNTPYDPRASLEDQIKQSVRLSLYNLRPTDGDEAARESYIDCLILHSPIHPFQQTLLAWKVLETYVPDRISSLGVSNITLEELRVLYNEASVKPRVVQNRFYSKTGYDTALRTFCHDKDIVYESFWTLTANPGLLRSGPVAKLVQAVGVEGEVALYALVMAQKVAVLNGTTNRASMENDMSGIAAIQQWADSNSNAWQSLNSEFQAMLR